MLNQSNEKQLLFLSLHGLGAIFIALSLTIYNVTPLSLRYERFVASRDIG